MWTYYQRNTWVFNTTQYLNKIKIWKIEKKTAMELKYLEINQQRESEYIVIVNKQFLPWKRSSYASNIVRRGIYKPSPLLVDRQIYSSISSIAIDQVASLSTTL